MLCTLIYRNRELQKEFELKKVRVFSGSLEGAFHYDLLYRHDADFREALNQKPNSEPYIVAVYHRNDPPQSERGTRFFSLSFSSRFSFLSQEEAQS